LALRAQVEYSTLLPSDQAIAQLQADLKQLQSLKLQMQNYQATWQQLTPALQALSDLSQTDKTSLTELTKALANSDQDSQAVSQLSTKLSSQFKTLSASYSMVKTVNAIAIPVTILSVVTTILCVVTKGFTKP
jgi:ABC-type transporter Mla subunit MlaD